MTVNFVRLLTLTLILCSIGCGGGASDRKPVHAVSGKITLAGAPVIGASVTFGPVESGMPVATGRTDDNGQFKLTTYDFNDGAAAGKFIVMVSKTAPGGGGAGGAPQHDPDGKSGISVAPSHDAGGRKQVTDETVLLNPMYAGPGSGLDAEVKAGGPNEFTFELKP